jgi:hypothetical protein
MPEPTPTITSTPTPSQADLLLPAAQSEGQLNVIALPHDWMNFGEIISVFSHKYGIAVKELDPNAGSSTELKAIRNGRITGDPLAPDVIDVGVTFAMQAKAENLLLPYKVSAWSSIPEAAKTHTEQRQRSAHVTRLVAKLRGHGLISKIKNARIYRPTPRGIRSMSAAIHCRNITFPAYAMQGTESSRLS